MESFVEFICYNGNVHHVEIIKEGSITNIPQLEHRLLF